jgi:hypothetical protein
VLRPCNSQAAHLLLSGTGTNTQQPPNHDNLSAGWSELCNADANGHSAQRQRPCGAAVGLKTIDHFSACQFTGARSIQGENLVRHTALGCRR